MTHLAWPYPAIVTGVGSMPGTDVREATTIVVGEFGSFPHVVELPERGPGSDLIGRTACLLAEVDRSFEVETTVTGWRVGHAGQAVLRRARSWFAQDLEVLEELSGSHRGPVKVQLTGPLTLAARVEDAAGESLLRDLGAVSEVAGACASAAREVVMRMRRAFPHAQVVVQLDEPDLPAVLAGRVRTSSGRLTYRSLEAQIVQGHLRTVMEAIAAVEALPGVRCAAFESPIDLFIESGAQFVGVDLHGQHASDESLPRAWESGVGLMLGCVPRASVGDSSMGDTQVSALLRTFMATWGFGEVPGNVALTPSGGLSGLSQVQARAAIERCVRVGSIVRDEHPEVVGG